MSEELDFCLTCDKAYLRPTGEVVVRGEHAGDHMDIGNRRIFKCENCGEKLVRFGHHEYLFVGNDVKTERSMIN